MKYCYLFVLQFFIVPLKAQVGIGTSIPHGSSILHIESTDKGILIPKVSLSSINHKLNADINNAHSLLVFNEGTNLSEGFYYWKSKMENDEDNGNWIIMGKDEVSSPSFFYMPSVVLPTNKVTTSYVAYNTSTDTYTVDLYEAFKNQFDAPIKSSNSISNNLSDLVLPRNMYEYHIIYADNTVFPHTDIIFSTTTGDEGKFTYKVSPDVIIRNGSFMNIVLKVK